MRKTLVIFLTILSLGIFTGGAIAAPALPGASDATKKDDADAAKDPFGRDNPRSTVAGFLEAISAQDYDKAANFLELGKEKDEGADIAKRLQNVLDQSGWIKLVTNISDKPAGETDDDLPPELEKIGGIHTEKKMMPVLLERVAAKKDQPAYWQFSSETVTQIASMEKDAKSSLLNKYLPAPLIDNQWWGVPIGHWLGLIVFAVLSYIVVWCITRVLKFVCRVVRKRLYAKETTHEIIEAIAVPLQLYISVCISVFVIRRIGVSLLARQTFSQLAGVLGWISLAWVVWRLIDVFSVILRNRLINHSQYSLLSAVVFFRRGTKLALFVIVLISVLDSFGFQITTWLAALGIGGIAIALGAQKTVENFVGSLTLIADRPIAIGDFCKFGTATGTVEDIGMRSTRIRTADRTLVSIPNGDFASMQIENYSKRDYFNYAPILSLSYDTAPDKIRKLLIEIRKMLNNEAKVKKDSITVFFTQFAKTALSVEVACYILVPTFNESQEIRGNLNLKIMDIVNECGIEFAPPPAFATKADA